MRMFNSQEQFGPNIVLPGNGLTRQSQVALLVDNLLS